MNLALTAVEEAEYFRAEAGDIKDAVEEADLEDVAQVDMDMDMKGEEIIDAEDKMQEWCDAMTDQNWRFTCNITSLTIDVTVYPRKKE